MSDIHSIIVDAFEKRADITPRNVSTSVRDAVNEAIEQLDRGEIRVRCRAALSADPDRVRRAAALGDPPPGRLRFAHTH